MHIDLLSPTSFASGQPHDQFRWLREYAPVHWHEEPGGRGFGPSPATTTTGRWTATYRPTRPSPPS